MSEERESKIRAFRLGLTLPGAPSCGEVWKHYKGGLYLIVCRALREDDLEEMVVYKNLETGDVFTRPLEEWQARSRDFAGSRFSSDHHLREYPRFEFTGTSLDMGRQ